MYNTYGFTENYYPEFIKQKMLSDECIRFRIHKHNYIYFSKEYEEDKVNIWCEMSGVDINSQFYDFIVKIQDIDKALLIYIQRNFIKTIKKELSDLEKVVELLENNVALI